MLLNHLKINDISLDAQLPPLKTAGVGFMNFAQDLIQSHFLTGRLILQIGVRWLNLLQNAGVILQKNYKSKYLHALQSPGSSAGAFLFPLRLPGFKVDREHPLPHGCLPGRCTPPARYRVV